ncbi:MAG: sensor histidine kinase [Candidatus Sericytochromatia bacterium]|nr:sensor histidine kinase [Candidatus Sericytochromatia bacterium]
MTGLLLPAAAQVQPPDTAVYFATQIHSIEDIKQLSEAQWQPAQQPLTPGFRPGSIWLRLQRQPGDAATYWLWLRRGALSEVCLYSQISDVLQGDCQPQSLTAEPSFVLTPEASVYYVAIPAHGMFLLPWQVLDTPNFEHQLFWTHLLDFAMLGALLTVILFNLLLFIRLKDKAYLYFVGYLLAMAAYWFGCFLGYCRFVEPEWRQHLSQGAELLLVLGFILAIRAYLHFLKMQKSELGLSFTLLRALEMALGATAVLSLWSSQPFVWMSLYTLLFLLCLCFMWILSMAWLQGKPLAGLFSWAWLLILVGVTLTLGINSSALPSVDGVFRLSGLIFVSAYLLISQALSEHILDLRKEREALLQAQTKNLEARVAERTQELEQALQQLEASNRFKNRLFSIVAHDLRSPLANLSSLLALVGDGTLNAAESKQMMQRLQNQTQSLLRSLDNLLHWSQDQISGQAPRKQVLALDDILTEIYQLYLPVAQQKGVALQKLSAKHLSSLGEPDQIRLIIRNLVNNAIKFTPGGKSVTLSATQSAEGIAISVQDQGIGMNTGQLQRLLDRDSYQVRAGTEGEKGLGLGLELCQNYAHYNGGDLLVNSQPGQGTTFILRLPPSRQTADPA